MVDTYKGSNGRGPQLINTPKNLINYLNTSSKNKLFIQTIIKKGNFFT